MSQISDGLPGGVRRAALEVDRGWQAVALEAHQDPWSTGYSA